MAAEDRPTPPTAAEYFAAFPGFDLGEYTKVPNILADELLPHLGEADLKVLLFLMRRTFGFHKAADAVSLDQIEHGIRRRDGGMASSGTGLSRTSIHAALRRLGTWGLLEVRETFDPRHGGRLANVYILRQQASGEPAHEGAPVRDAAPPTPQILMGTPPQDLAPQKNPIQEDQQKKTSDAAAPRTDGGQEGGDRPIPGSCPPWAVAALGGAALASDASPRAVQLLARSVAAAWPGDPAEGAALIVAAWAEVEATISARRLEGGPRILRPWAYFARVLHDWLAPAPPTPQTDAGVPTGGDEGASPAAKVPEAARVVDGSVIHAGFPPGHADPDGVQPYAASSPDEAALLWARLSAALACIVAPSVHATRIAPLRGVALVDGRLALAAPSAAHAAWCTGRLVQALRAASADIGCPDLSTTFLPPGVGRMAG